MIVDLDTIEWLASDDCKTIVMTDVVRQDLRALIRLARADVALRSRTTKPMLRDDDLWAEYDAALAPFLPEAKP